MSENTFPSVRQADEGGLTGLIKTALEKQAQSTDGMMPVEVVAYDRAKNRATVRHLIQMQGTDGQAVDRANVAEVRVYQFGNGKFAMSLPIKPGDKGWLKAADRDLSNFQERLEKGTPNTRRMHSFQDSIFMPDAMAMGDVPAPESDRVVIGNTGGGTILSFDDDGFYFTVGGVSVNITADGVTVTGGMITHDTLDIGSTHRHRDVTPGAANTGIPV